MESSFNCMQIGNKCIHMLYYPVGTEFMYSQHSLVDKLLYIQSSGCFWARTALGVNK